MEYKGKRIECVYTQFEGSDGKYYFVVKIWKGDNLIRESESQPDPTFKELGDSIKTAERYAKEWIDAETCPLCWNLAEIKMVNSKDEWSVDCLKCGDFSFTGPAKTRLDNLRDGNRDTIKFYIGTANKKGKRLILTIDEIDAILVGPAS